MHCAIHRHAEACTCVCVGQCLGAGLAARLLERFQTELRRMDEFDIAMLEGLEGEARLQALIEYREFSSPILIPLSGFCDGVAPILWDMRTKHADGHFVPLDLTLPLQSRSALDLAFIATYLKGTRDLDIVSQVTETGVRFDADLPYQIAIMPHLVTMPPGFKATDVELRRLAKLGYMEFLDMIPFCPYRTIQQGSVPRPYAPLRPRRISNASGVHYVLHDDDKVAYTPLNTAIASKRDLGGPYSYKNRTTVTTGRLGASAIVPPAPCALPNTKHPPETKPSNADLMHDAAVLGYAGAIFKLPLFIGNDDLSDAFNQFHVAQCDLWLIGFVWLDLAALGPKPLRFVAEYVLGFGYTNASNVCQRYMDSVMEAIMRRMDVDDAPYFASRTAPAEVAYICTRRELTRVTGRNQLSFCRARAYTDDPAFLVLGVARFVRLLRHWSHFLEGARHRTATVDKGQFGCHAKWNGAEHFASLGVVVIPKPKIIKACAMLGRVISAVANGAVSGQRGHDLPTCAEWKKHCGLLRHLADILGMAREAMHLMYWPLNARHNGDHTQRRLDDPGAPILLCDEFVQQCERWNETLLNHDGVSNHVVFDSVRGIPRTPHANPFILTCDAALKGTTSPGIGGYMHTYAWRIALTSDEVLPISVLEYVAIAVNLIEFAALLPRPLDEVELMLGSDSDNSVQDLVDLAAKSYDMQYVTLKLRELDEFTQLAPNMLVGQIYGEGNPVADAVSRGWWKLIAAYERQLGVKLVWITPSARSLAFLNDVRNAHTRRLSAVESSRSTAHSNCDAGDGPSSIGSPLDTPPRPAARRGVSHHLAATPPATAPRSSGDPLDSPPKRLRLRPQHSPFQRRPSARGLVGSRLDADPNAQASSTTVCPFGGLPGFAHESVVGDNGAAETGSGGAALSSLASSGYSLPRSRALQQSGGDGVQPSSPPRAALKHVAPATPPARSRRRTHAHQPHASDIHDTRGAPNSGISFSPPAPRVERRPFKQDDESRDDLSGLSRDLADAGSQPRVGEFIESLRQDRSHLALRPTNPELLTHVITEIGQFVTKGVPENTLKKEKSAMKHYERACALLGTPVWRKGANFHGPNGSFELEREVTFWTICVIMVWRWMKPRRRHHKTARVDSALAVVLAARRLHVRNRIEVPPVAALKSVLLGMKQRYVELNGADALLPQRKEPLTDADTTAMLDAPMGTSCAGHRVDWSQPRFIVFKAMLLTMRKSGFRKADALSLRADLHPMDLRRSHLLWRCNGEFHWDMTPSLRAQMRTGRDMAVIKPAGSKADPLAEYFGTQPIYLPWDASEPLNPAVALAQMAIAVPVGQHERQQAALFSTGDGPLLMKEADAMFAALARAQLSGARAAQLSLHSPRVYLACALKALRADDPTIQALCRWKTPESIKIYGRLTPEDYAALVRRTGTVTTSSVQATNLHNPPPQSDDDAFYSSIDSTDNTRRMSDDAADDDDVDVDEDAHLDEFAQPGECAADAATTLDVGQLVCVPWTYDVDGQREWRHCVGRVVKAMMSFSGQTCNHGEQHYLVRFVADDTTYAAPASRVYFVAD